MKVQTNALACNKMMELSHEKSNKFIKYKKIISKNHVDIFFFQIKCFINLWKYIWRMGQTIEVKVQNKCTCMQHNGWVKRWKTKQVHGIWKIINKNHVDVAFFQIKCFINLWEYIFTMVHNDFHNETCICAMQC